MDLKRILQKIEEEWVAGTENIGGEYREIFKNPTKSEIIDLGEEDHSIRFIADRGNREVYIASGDVFHDIIVKELSKRMEYILENFSGSGWIQRGEVEVRALSDQYWIEEFEGMKSKKRVEEEVLSGYYDWMERYNFNLSSIKKEIREGRENNENK